MKVLSSPQDLLTGKAICMGVLASSTTTRRSPSITPEELDLLLYSEPRRHTGLPYNTYEGLVSKFNRKFVARDIQTLSSRLRQQVEPFLKLGPVRLCKGARLNQATLKL